MGKRITGVAALAAALLLSGCAASAHGGAAGPAGAATTAPPAHRAVPGKTSDTAAAFRKWGLEPLAAPPAPPRVKPVRTGRGGQVPVISEIPTADKVVFLTFDDGAEKDPRFVGMMRDLKVPFTMFLTDAAIRADYGYFKPLSALGNGVANHTVSHPDLRTLGAAAQQREICGQQRRLERTYGSAPRLFRPPYGNWNEDTRAAAGRCGVEAIVLWRESMQITNMQYQRGDRKLRPGDIVLAHFRGPKDLKGTTMTGMTANMLRRIQEQGFTVARLEDYV
ncbi:polysaccharide deacetylase family protein [Streptomyces sp. NPDC050856]|uniref:polysaccharide deacetylase family protein n=1 Tax=Streptomyces sp. NPDC050856 TaxID=3154939 RepID=UPI0033D71487